MLSFIVLAYNEEANIEAAVLSIMEASRLVGLADFEIVGVDDGSSDKTGEILARLTVRDSRVRVVVNEVNSGIGVSVRRALAAASGKRVMIVPGDNDMSQEMIRLLLSYRDAADVVLAFPINTEDRSIGRHILSVLYRLIHVVAFRVFVNYVNAPSICPTATMKSLPLRSQGYSMVAEYTVKLLRSGCSYAEVPGFVQNPNRGRKRRTVTLKNLWEVMRSFVRLFAEVHAVDRKRYDNVPRRVFIDFTAGVISSRSSSPPVVAGARDARA